MDSGLYKILIWEEDLKRPFGRIVRSLSSRMTNTLVQGWVITTLPTVFPVDVSIPRQIFGKQEMNYVLRVCVSPAFFYSPQVCPGSSSHFHLYCVSQTVIRFSLHFWVISSREWNVFILVFFSPIWPVAMRPPAARFSHASPATQEKQ